MIWRTAAVTMLSGAWALAQTGEVIVRASSAARIVPGKLRPGTTVEGIVERPVFAADREILPAGSRVRLDIASVEKQHRPGPGWLRRVSGLATGSPRPRARYAFTAGPASISWEGGGAISARAEILDILEQRQLTGSIAARPSSRASGSSLILRLPDGVPLAAARPRREPTATLSPGGSVRARVMLLRGIRASESRQDDVVQARLMEPLPIRTGLVLPAGTRIDGHLTAVHGPRRLFRPAKMRLSFNRLALPDGSSQAISTVLSSASVEKGAGGSLDSEGGISGGPAGKLRMAIDLGVAYATGKILDDLLEESLQLGLGAGVSGSAATAARYVGLGSGAILLILQRGRDVSLPAYTELELTFTRPLDSPLPNRSQ